MCRLFGLMMALAGSLIGITFPGHTARAVSFGQLDDFQDGTTMNWSQGAASPNPTSNVPTGGPAGDGDAYLLNVSNGLGSAGSKQVMFNHVQWLGDYNAAGVTRIRLNLANFGPSDLFIRLWIEGGPLFSSYGSTNPIVLPANTGWASAVLDLTPSAMSPISGTDSLSSVLGNVIDLRVVSNQFGPSMNGDNVQGSLGVDNIRAMRLEGDANFDGKIDTLDFNSLAANFGGTGKTWSQADFNFDGKVDTLDFNNLAANFGQQLSGSNSPALVPEPAQISLLLLCGAVTWRRARRRSERARNSN